MEPDDLPPAAVCADLTVAERSKALQLAQQGASRRLGPSRWIPLALFLLVIAGSALVRALAPPWSESLPGWSWILVLIVVGALAATVMVRLQRKLAAELSAQLELSADSEHLTLRTENSTMRWPWAAVVGCDLSHDMIVVSVRGLLTIAVPQRAFATEEAMQSFLSYVRSHASSKRAAPVPSALTTSQTLPNRASDQTIVALIREFKANFYAGVLLLGLRSTGLGYLRVSTAQFVLLVVLDLVVSVAIAWLHSGGQGFFNWYALPNNLFFVLTILTAATIAAWLAARSEHTFALAVAIAALGFPTALLHGSVSWFLDVSMRYWLWWSVIGWTSLASVVAAVRILQPTRLRAAFVVPAMLITLIAPVFFIDFSEQLWVSLEDRNGETAEHRARYERARGEAVLYVQPRLLSEALDAVAPGKPGVVELFYVGFAGSGYQDVFLEEVTGAEQVLRDRFALGPHSVILANSMRTPEERPFATKTSLQRVLDDMARKMNGDEDILFLFLSAHGARNHELDVQMPPYRFKPLSAAEVRTMLDAAGIVNRVIVVSACYSGGFIPPNESPEALIITASQADRTSFGCRDGAQWTYFGQAFFSEALAQERSIEDAFRVATRRIGERETAEKLTASEPQMFVGDRIRAPLQSLYERVARPHP